MRRLTLAVLLILAGILMTTAIAPAVSADELTATPPAERDQIDELIHKVVLKHLPDEYENTKQWGRTKEVWDGLKIWRDGLRIKTKRRKKAANHGTWKRYRAWLIDPERELQIQITDVQELEQGRVAFWLTIVARLGTFARLSEWRRDVQLISLSANANARVRLRLRCEVGSQLDFDHLPPDMLVVARVTDAQLDLLEFRLEHLSELRGPLAKELGESLHDVLQDELNQRRGKLVERINRQLEKNQDHLRLSVRDLGTRGWEELLEFLHIRASDREQEVE